MIAWKIILGVVLFTCSSLITGMLPLQGISFTVQGIDYAPQIVEKVLDALAGSLIVWGFLQNPRVSKAKY